MTKSFLAALILSLFTSISYARAERILASDRDIVGNWRFDRIILDGEERPPFNPDLIIEFNFREDGSDTLLWYRNNEKGFCERDGRYAFDGEFLKDKVTWVNPQNRLDCARDPDMQLGRETSTPAVMKNGELYMTFEVDDQTLTYIWTRTIR